LPGGGEAKKTGLNPFATADAPQQRAVPIGLIQRHVAAPMGRGLFLGIVWEMTE
jgi:hypothetical protein